MAGPYVERLVGGKTRATVGETRACVASSGEGVISQKNGDI